MDAVYHLSDSDRVTRCFRNVKNLLRDSDDVGVVEVVAHADAVTAFQAGSETADRVNSLLEAGVKVTVCANSLENSGIPRDELVEGVDVAGSAQTVLVRRQHEGYSYVKP